MKPIEDNNLPGDKPLTQADPDKMDFAKDGLNCLKCHYRHKDNGNCKAVGGFCTSVPASYCPLIPELLAENAALRRMQPVRMDADCASNMALAAEVSEIRQNLEEAEARADEAEASLAAAVRDMEAMAATIRARPDYDTDCCFLCKYDGPVEDYCPGWEEEKECFQWRGP